MSGLWGPLLQSFSFWNQTHIHIVTILTSKPFEVNVYLYLCDLILLLLRKCQKSLLFWRDFRRKSMSMLFVSSRNKVFCQDFNLWSDDISCGQVTKLVRCVIPGRFCTWISWVKKSFVQWWQKLWNTKSPQSSPALRSLQIRPFLLLDLSQEGCQRRKKINQSCLNWWLIKRPFTTRVLKKQARVRVNANGVANLRWNRKFLVWRFPGQSSSSIQQDPGSADLSLLDGILFFMAFCCFSLVFAY